MDSRLSTFYLPQDILVVLSSKAVGVAVLLLECFFTTFNTRGRSAVKINKHLLLTAIPLVRNDHPVTPRGPSLQLGDQGSEVRPQKEPADLLETEFK
jgi:hypothetical protein